MEFRIADTFVASIGKLSIDEQKLVKQATFNAQLNPANPGLKYHRVDNCKDKNVWSLRVNKDIRIIVHRTFDSLLFCHADHHDKAYAWARKHKLGIHPKTGAVTMIELQEIQEPGNTKKTITPRIPLFSSVSDESLKSYGVPSELISVVRSIANHEDLLKLLGVLPEKATEALTDLAIGRVPQSTTEAAINTDEIPTTAFNHPEAKQHFPLIESAKELQEFIERAITKALEKSSKSPQSPLSPNIGSGPKIITDDRENHPQPIAHDNKKIEVLPNPIKKFILFGNSCDKNEFEKYIINNNTNNKICMVYVKIVYYDKNSINKIWYAKNFGPLTSLDGNLNTGFLRKWRDKKIKEIELKIS